jgi:hypothetical protein
VIDGAGAVSHAAVDAAPPAASAPVDVSRGTPSVRHVTLP